MVVVPPSVGAVAPYQLIRGTLDDLARLSVALGIAKPPPQRISAPAETGPIPIGKRNRTIWEHCMRQARHCDALRRRRSAAPGSGRRAEATGREKPMQGPEIACVYSAHGAWPVSAKIPGPQPSRRVPTSKPPCPSIAFLAAHSVHKETNQGP
jgi:hypothetical protein